MKFLSRSNEQFSSLTQLDPDFDNGSHDYYSG